jgi:glucarate dehydratase
MKIVGFKIHSIAIADPPLRSSYGLHAPYALRNVIEITSEDGVVGIAETYGGDSPRKALEALRKQIIGADAFRLTGNLLPMLRGVGEGFQRSQTFLVPGETRSTRRRAHSRQ